MEHKKLFTCDRVPIETERQIIFIYKYAYYDKQDLPVVIIDCFSNSFWLS